MSPKKKSGETVKVRWLVSALCHDVGDETEEPKAWVDRVGLKAELVEIVGDAKRTPKPVKPSA